MANGLKFSPRKTALALAVAVVCAWQSPVFAHGSEAHMVPLDKTLQEFGADVQWDDYAQMFTLIKDGAYVKVKPGAIASTPSHVPRTYSSGRKCSAVGLESEPPSCAR